MITNDSLLDLLLYLSDTFLLSGQEQKDKISIEFVSRLTSLRKKNVATLLTKIQITFKFYFDIQILNILSLPRKNNKTVKLPLKQKTNLMAPCSTIKNWLKVKQIWLKIRL